MSQGSSELKSLPGINLIRVGKKVRLNVYDVCIRPTELIASFVGVPVYLPGKAESGTAREGKTYHLLKPGGAGCFQMQAAVVLPDEVSDNRVD